MRKSNSATNARREHIRAYELLSIVILCSSVIFGSSAMTSAMKATPAPVIQPANNYSNPTTTPTIQATAPGTPVTTVLLQESSSDPVGTVHGRKQIRTLSRQAVTTTAPIRQPLQSN